MLVLARQLNQRIVLPTVPATIEVVSIKPGNVRLGIDAPPEVTILREEVLRRGRVPPRALIAKAEPVLFASSAVQKISPFPFPSGAKRRGEPG